MRPRTAARSVEFTDMEIFQALEEAKSRCSRTHRRALAQLREQAGEAEWLQQHGLGAVTTGTVDSLFVEMAGHHDHARPRRRRYAAIDVVQKIEAVTVRQIYVGQQDIRGARVILERLVATL